MRGLNVLATFQIRDRARDFENAVVRTRALQPRKRSR
jgi:hypothetical protein